MLITRIKGKGFYGPNIDQLCSEKMMFCGPNRSNKTTRTNIIHLCLNGFISTAHRVSKKPAEILNQYAASDTLTCAIEVGGSEFEFHISKNSKGVVSRRFRVDKKKYSEKEYITELALAGNPKIIDLESFVQMSEAKKIDQLFKLYPAKVDIKQLNSDIEKKKAKISKSEADIKIKKAVIRDNTKSRQLIGLPAGTLADIREELENHKIAYRGTRDKIVSIKAIQKQSEQDVNPNATHNESAPVPSGTFPGVGEVTPTTLDGGMQASHNSHADNHKKIITESLEKVLRTMEKTACQMCVASLVCKKELKKCQTN